MRLGQKTAGFLLVLSLTHGASRAADAGATPAPTVDTTPVEAGDADAEPPARKLVKWNEFDWKYSTLRLGFGTLLDYATYAQDSESTQQFAMDGGYAMRDFRLMFNGKFKTKRLITWTLGYMYDDSDDSWRFRQTGIQIAFPEAHGNLFIGRTKEGYSLLKVMTGYHPWTMERSPSVDAFAPILADGVKWMGYFSKPGVFYSFGYFDDELSDHEKFSTFDRQFVTRVGWTPVLSEEEGRVLHVGVSARDGRPNDKSIQVRARPEAGQAPYFVDTGRFAADHAFSTGVESYYRSGPWMFGGEYYWDQVDALSGERPLLHGGQVVATWMITGETRPYNAPGGFFTAISPTRTVFEGGKGAWEAVLNLSYTNFESGSFQGGKLWRITPEMNWSLSDNMKLQFAYGYSELDRFGLEGRTQFFQTRLQLML